MKPRLFTALTITLLASVAVSCSKSGGESAGESGTTSKRETLPEAQVVDIVNAANRKDLAKVTALLQANPKLVSAKWTGGGPGDGWPLLMIAAERGDKPMVELFLRFGADVNDKNYDGYVALHSAAGEGYKDIVQMLLDHKADVNVKSEIGETPLQLAANSGKRDIVALLKQHGAKE